MKKYNKSQIEAFNSIKQTLPAKRKAVFSAVLKMGGSATILQISEFLGVPFNYVSGRITELCNKGILKDSGKTTINPLSKKSMTIWTIK